MSVEFLLENSIATSILSTTDQDSIISAQILGCLIDYKQGFPISLPCLQSILFSLSLTSVSYV